MQHLLKLEFDGLYSQLTTQTDVYVSSHSFNICDGNFIKVFYMMYSHTHNLNTNTGSPAHTTSAAPHQPIGIVAGEKTERHDERN